MNIAVLGAGGWGTTLAIHLARKNHRVRLWEVFPDYALVLQGKRKNLKFLPEISIPKEILISSDLGKVIFKAEVIIIAVPSFAMREVLEKLKIFDFSGMIILSATKGLEMNTNYRMSEVIEEELGDKIKWAVLSGPTVAKEVARGTPTTAVVASNDGKVAAILQRMLMGNRLRLYTSSDTIGVELGGCLKNIIAIAAGIADGLGFGANTKAALLTRGLAEMQRLGKKMGAKAETFIGLSGLGDLVTTCTSKNSRNRNFGEAIGQGKKMEQLLKKTEMVIEGINTTSVTCHLAKKFKVEMPITNAVYKVLFKDKNPLTAVNELMNRKEKTE
ncbi:MAG: glycerol-3-phosphate dehydrogenase [bacterium (Candidatus Ratteibacteria) CG_4_10_14_3_um_filter_41_18]|uniref:Glycerol-3-phosphate dehydrogenase [NAD(P)+] n=4 Tax=Candidatus Ratteibacteria TaxID=2979319 RepID=A0A2M7YEP6_9BACT|nr:MAG: glycerol-3-phosphate dehydrogenase [Candidatus Omnitrophica bacterium CG1_02_41_171]PIV64034.1 MAG: glycerol-3-phosphate dehydrogenase [bacterium (Candidatus Ratteibacteria) CG01_land_8_20_14_3_00_40_19]PIW33011.1 MAG: glycerol-3-phosphate dehydrogenase [bacterium (Candidatus Ratteibacteria) CG15_BIG_FIL_POST_REV_8_21_14_020_41_12]PIW73781.1 MAG: glycerol-3-phosphate dehydrogenase [bacterium (Candidatus Ratteibacteria) CG_4_8_14_3_um_filter_41_36]PIX77265.1 MAG: glycerol-3-phosphate deh